MASVRKVTDTYRRAKKPQKPTPAKKAKKDDAVPSTSSHLLPDANPDLETLKQFDLCLEYGPCIGITRLERWERAQKHGLNPPPKVKDILLRHPKDDNYTQSHSRFLCMDFGLLSLRRAHCHGITRLEKWERAQKHGLNPPPKVKDILLRHPKDDNYTQSHSRFLCMDFGLLSLRRAHCHGITRLERWERAQKHGLNPPPKVKDILLRHPKDDNYTQSLWKDYNI